MSQAGVLPACRGTRRLPAGGDATPTWIPLRERADMALYLSLRLR
jgi:hypothetical protein